MHPTRLTVSSEHRRGFTLVEVLVSAAVLLVGVLGLVAVLVKGGELEVSDRHRRRARELIDSCMEEWTVVPACDYDAVPTETVEVIIDERDTTTTDDDLTGLLGIDTIPHTVGDDPGEITNLACKQVHVEVKWPEPDRVDSVSMVMKKWVTDLE